MSRVFQNPLDGTAPRMTVEENMLLALKRGQKRGLVSSRTPANRQVLKEQLAQLGLGLEQRLDTEIGVLSGGQRQAISLLMACLQRPQLLLLDEHTAALDPQTQQLVMRLTETLIQWYQLTTLMITHQLHDAARYGNRLVVMQRGRIAHDIREMGRCRIPIFLSPFAPEMAEDFPLTLCTKGFVQRMFMPFSGSAICCGFVA